SAGADGGARAGDGEADGPRHALRRGALDSDLDALLYPSRREAPDQALGWARPSFLRQRPVPRGGEVAPAARLRPPHSLRSGAHELALPRTAERRPRCCRPPVSPTRN
ncbi:unnamed protein product, partial [Ectocarpus sp. 8 AP-2014]